MKTASNNASPRRRRRLATLMSFVAGWALTVVAPLRQRRREIARAMHVGATWCAIVVVALPPTPTLVSAAEYFWDNNGTATDNYFYTGAGLGGSPGAWNTTNAKWWLNGALSDTAWINGTHTAVFQGGTPGTVSLGTDIDVGGLKFNTSGYMIATGTSKLNFTNVGATPNVITLNGTTTATINGTSTAPTRASAGTTSNSAQAY